MNTRPDWPHAAQLAARLWERGGEEPVDGVISFTPAFLARILSVMGRSRSRATTRRSRRPTSSSGSTSTPTSARALGTDRKDFIAVLAKVVMDRLIEARTSQWASLGKVVADSFGPGRRWRGPPTPRCRRCCPPAGGTAPCPTSAGDFVFPAEFEYAAKNGRALRRTYQHHVAIRPDGSGTVTTTVRITNPKPLDTFGNPAGVLTFVSMYGPQGATVAEGSDPLSLAEPEVAGHPARSWFRPLNPESESTVTVVWDVPRLATQRPDGTWVYSVLWMRLPDHTGDVLQLGFDLPAGWEWADEPPPTQVALDNDFSGTWALST